MITMNRVSRCTAPSLSIKAMFGLLIVTFLLAAETLAYGLADSTDVAIKKGADPVWYSQKNQQIVPARPSSRDQIDASDRFSKVAAPKGSNSSANSWLYEFFKGLRDFLRDSWQIVLIAVLLAAAVLVVWILVRMQKFFDSPTRVNQSSVSLAAQQHKVTDLPFELDSPDIPLLQLVEEYRKRGDYSKAIIYLYSLMLIELDAVGLIRLAKGKTNWTYLSELNRRQEEKTYATTVVYWFEQVFFGKHRMDADAFEAIWSSLPHFRERLKLARGEQA